MHGVEAIVLTGRSVRHGEVFLQLRGERVQPIAVGGRAGRAAAPPQTAGGVKSNFLTGVRTIENDTAVPIIASGKNLRVFVAHSRDQEAVDCSSQGGGVMPARVGFGQALQPG